MSKADTPAGAPVTDRGGRPRVDSRTGRPIVGDARPAPVPADSEGGDK